MKIIVKKKNEESEIFDYAKLKNSIKFSGGSQSVVDMIVNYLIKEGMNTISSNELYQLTQKFLLKTKEKKAFLRYNLPQSIQKLGPEGFAFEKFVANVFRSYEYNPVFVGKKIQGKCMVHEMDIVAKKNGELLTAELKFHNSRSKKSDLKVVLYMKARFDDILNGKFYENQTPRQVIITNTKFSHNAKIYAKCAGVEIIAWNYPENNNLFNFILKSGVHPITAVSRIPHKAQLDFVKRKITSCRDVLKNKKKELLENPLIPNEKIEDIIKEIKYICSFSDEEKKRLHIYN